jgi:hypothetical protein
MCFLCLHVAAPLAAQDLLPLANLHSLEELSIRSPNKTFCQPLLSAQLASGLTSLTSLVLSKCPVSCLAHVMCCPALQALVMMCPVGLEEEMGPSEWSAVGELTSLVDLRLYNAEFLSPTTECFAAIRKLTGLQRLGAWMWSAEMLPALAICTKLTQLVGGWQDDGRSADGVLLPYVVELSETNGTPNVVILSQSDGMSTDAFTNLAGTAFGCVNSRLHMPVGVRASSPPGHSARVLRLCMHCRH